MDIEKVRLRLCLEQELIRLEQRRDGISPQVSAVRIFRENEICNPLVLEESLSVPKTLDREEFDKRVEKRLNALFKRQKMEASTLFAQQV
uniref:GED domain-containing protein n=1 Tax=Heterorhabditis bacteriophora TaxID=37862 RepID=A0A1I7XQ92_HETBA